MHIFDISSDALLHCYAVDEESNGGEAIHLFKSMKNAIGTGEGQYQTFGNNDVNRGTELSRKLDDTSMYR